MILVQEPDAPVWQIGQPTGVKPGYPLLNGHGTFRPCEECNPKGYEKWREGKFQRGGRDKRPVPEMPADYQGEF